MRWPENCGLGHAQGRRAVVVFVLGCHNSSFFFKQGNSTATPSSSGAGSGDAYRLSQWPSPRNEPTGFTPTNAVGLYSVEAVGNPRLPPALMSSKVKPCQGPPHSRLLGTLVAPAPLLCFWLYPDISFAGLQIHRLYEVVLCFSLHGVAAGSEWSRALPRLPACVTGCLIVFCGGMKAGVSYSPIVLSSSTKVCL